MKVQSGEILPHEVGKLCEGFDRGGGLHQGGGWQEVLIERSGPPVQSGQILPHGVDKLCEGSDRGGGLHRGGGWQEVLRVGV